MTRYEAREIDGRWAIYDTVDDRVTGWFGRGDAEHSSAASHAREMNDALRPAAADDDADQEPISLHAAFARHEVEQERRRRRGGGRS